MEHELRELVEKWKKYNNTIQSPHEDVVEAVDSCANELQQILDKYEFKSHEKSKSEK